MQFAVPQVELLGHICSSYGIKPSPKKVQAIYNAQPPTPKNELRSFLDLVTYTSRFIPDYSTLTAPLYDLMSSRIHFNWTDKHTECFNNLCSLVSEHVMLTAPRGSGPFVLICDASNTGIGSALAQI